MSASIGLALRSDASPTLGKLLLLLRNRYIVWFITYTALISDHVLPACIINALGFRVLFWIYLGLYLRGGTLVHEPGIQAGGVSFCMIVVLDIYFISSSGNDGYRAQSTSCTGP